MNRDQLLDDVLSLSHRILQLAEAGDWIAGSEQEQVRRALIERCFAADSAFVDAAAARKKIAQILQLDQQTIVLGRQQRQAVSHSIGKLRQGKAAVNAYQRAQR
jgi:hypothetical protein